MASPTSRPTLALAAAGACALMALWGSLDFYRASITANRTQGDPYRVAEQLGRFAGLDAIVPAGAAAGYLSDEPLDGVRGQAMFFLAQYAAAPRALRPSPEAEWVIAFYQSPADWRQVAATHKLELVGELSPGVAVFRKGGR